MKPLDDLLPLTRDPYLVKVQNHFSDLLNEVISYGTTVVGLDTKAKRSGKDNNIPTLFLRNILEISDAISILIRQSSIEPSKILLRSLLENMMSLMYMLEEDEKQRALCYMVFNANQQIMSFSKLLDSEESFNQFKIQLEKDSQKNDFSKFFNHPDIGRIIENKRNLLIQPQFAPIQQEYLRMKKLKKGKVKSWYSLFKGPENMYQLAEHLKKTVRYEFFYRRYSQTVHAQDLYKGMTIVSEGAAQILQIRNFKDTQPVTLTAVSLLIECLTNFIEKRLPDKREDFSNWYLTIRDSYLDLVNKKYINYRE